MSVLLDQLKAEGGTAMADAPNITARVDPELVALARERAGLQDANTGTLIRWALATLAGIDPASVAYRKAGPRREAVNYEPYTPGCTLRRRAA